MIRNYTFKTNYDNSITYRVTGDYSAKYYFADIVDLTGTKKCSFQITVTYASGTNKSTIILSLSKTNTNLFLTSDSIVFGS